GSFEPAPCLSRFRGLGDLVRSGNTPGGVAVNVDEPLGGRPALHEGFDLLGRSALANDFDAPVPVGQAVRDEAHALACRSLRELGHVASAHVTSADDIVALLAS